MVNKITKKVDLKNRTENSLRNSSVGLISQILQALGSFACRMVFVRCLSQEYLGVNGLFADVISILSVAELGIGASIAFELYSALANDNQSLITSLMEFYRKAYRIIGITIGIIGCCLLPVINLIVKKDPAITESIYILYMLYLSETVVSYFFSYKQTILQAGQQNYVISIAEMTMGLIKNIIQIVVLITTHNFILYLIIQVLFRILTNVIIAKAADKAFPYISSAPENNYLDKEVKKRLTNNIKYIFTNSFFGKLVNSTDTIIITSLISLSAAGVNSNYTLIVSTMQAFTTRILEGLTGSIGNINATESKSKKMESFRMVYLVFYWILLWCTCCFICISSDVVGIFFGKNYVMPINVVIVIGFNYFQQQLFVSVSNYRATLGLFKFGRFTTLVTGIINIVLSIILGKQFGIIGILIATFISRLLTMDWYFPYIVYRKGFETSPIRYYLNSILYWIEAIGIVAFTYFLCSLVTLSILPNIIIKMIICIVVPNIIIIIFNCWRQEFKDLCSKVKVQIVNKRNRNG